MAHKTENEVDGTRYETLADLFENECVLAINIGMSYEQYFYGNPELLYIYAKAYMQKEKSKFAETDLKAWMAGSYVKAALANVMSYAFGEKGKSKVEYPNQPAFISQIDEEAKKKKREREVRNFELNFIAAVHNIGASIEEAVQK